MFRTLAAPLFGGAILNSPVLFASMEGSCKDPAAVYNEPPPRQCKKRPSDECRQTELERCIAKCREEYGPMKSTFQDYLAEAGVFIKDTSVTVMENVDYLQRCAPPEVQYGAIAAGGFVGSLFGFRRGLFKKLFYGAIGSAVTASIIFPEEAKVVAKEGFELTKTYTLIAYNFAVGSQPKQECKPKKKPCPPKEVTIPKNMCSGLAKFDHMEV